MTTTNLRLALPKGKMQEGVMALLSEAGIRVNASDRGYRPRVSMANVEAKILKPQSIVKMLHHGSRDIGFAGADWVAELDANVVELLDTGLDPVRVVAAAPKTMLIDGQLPQCKLRTASEYERLTKNWIAAKGIDAEFVRSYGATEVFPPEDADLIVDNTATGSTLKANGLSIVDELMLSSTRLYASPLAMKDPEHRMMIEEIVLLLSAVIEARKRVMVEVNVTEANLEAVIAVLPCMREPTVSPLHGSAGYSVKSAVLRDELTRVIPAIKRAGGEDIIVFKPVQIVE